MKTIQGPAIFLAQFLGDEPPFDSLEHLAQWAAGLGYKGLQLPTAPRLFDLQQAANSQQYCDDVAALLARHGLQVTELSTHLQGQLIAVHPAYDALFDGFAPEHVRGDPLARTAWATQQLLWAA
ncbi:MAG: sugar phosphate isomerase/epimerase, partial [Janthinobacterium sp.]